MLSVYVRYQHASTPPCASFNSLPTHSPSCAHCQPPNPPCIAWIHHLLGRLVLKCARDACRALCSPCKPPSILLNSRALAEETFLSFLWLLFVCFCVILALEQHVPQARLRRAALQHPSHATTTIRLVMGRLFP